MTLFYQIVRNTSAVSSTDSVVDINSINNFSKLRDTLGSVFHLLYMYVICEFDLFYEQDVVVDAQFSQLYGRPFFKNKRTVTATANATAAATSTATATATATDTATATATTATAMISTTNPAVG